MALPKTLAFLRTLPSQRRARPRVTFVQQATEAERRTAHELWLQIQHGSSDSNYRPH